jgi:hypothetical protein
MAEPREITFSRPKHVGPGWQIEARWPRGHIEVITFTSEAKADEWLAGSRSKAWLKARGFA